MRGDVDALVGSRLPLPQLRDRARCTRGVRRRSQPRLTAQPGMEGQQDTFGVALQGVTKTTLRKAGMILTQVWAVHLQSVRELINQTLRGCTTYQPLR